MSLRHPVRVYLDTYMCVCIKYMLQNMLQNVHMCNMYVLIYAHMCKHQYMFIYIHMYVCLFIYICIYMYMYVYIYMYIHVYVYICRPDGSPRALVCNMRVCVADVIHICMHTHKYSSIHIMHIFVYISRCVGIHI